MAPSPTKISSQHGPKADPTIQLPIIARAFAPAEAKMGIWLLISHPSATEAANSSRKAGAAATSSQPDHAFANRPGASDPLHYRTAAPPSAPRAASNSRTRCPLRLGSSRRRAMEVSVCWFPCLAVADAGVRGVEGGGGLGDGFFDGVVVSLACRRVERRRRGRCGCGTSQIWQRSGRCASSSPSPARSSTSTSDCERLSASLVASSVTAIAFSFYHRPAYLHCDFEL
jgi:hypothetical protein